jgi:xanthine/CO dehydrogenase XdhC/CoxF family maturation factor
MAAEFELILETIDEWSKHGIGFALATVVGARGSTYRGLAARQLMADDAASVGTVSGGCLDKELASVAREVISSGLARLVEFDLTADDEEVWGWGIGCNGVTELLVEPAPGAMAWARLVRSPPRGLLAILHSLDAETLGEHRPVLAGDPMWSAEAEEALASDRNQRLSKDGADYLLEVVAGPSRLVVCGAGHDAVPMVRFGAELGFEVIVVDDRRQFLTRERFPEASALVQCAPAELARHVEIGSRTAVVVMTHNYLRDVDYLKSLMGTSAIYIGCLGPGARLERLLKDVEAAGVVPTGDDLAKIHGPAGLDVGAEGPVEIAWSVMAEILAARRRHQGGSLRDRKGPASVRPQ